MKDNKQLFTDDISFQDNYVDFSGDNFEKFNLICFKNGRFNFEGTVERKSYNDTWGYSGNNVSICYEGNYSITKEDNEILIILLQTENMSCVSKSISNDDESKFNRQEIKTITFSSLKWANKYGFTKELNIHEQLEKLYPFKEIIFNEESYILQCLKQLGLYEFNQQPVDLLKKNHGDINKTFSELYPEVLEKRQLLLDAIPKEFQPRSQYHDYMGELNLIILRAKSNLIAALNNWDSYHFGKLVDYEQWCNKDLGLTDQIEIIKLYYSSYYLYKEIIDPTRFPDRKEFLHNHYLNLLSFYNLTVPYGEFTEEKIIDRMFYHYNTNNETYEIYLIYEITGNKILAFRKFLNRFTDNDLRRRAAFACEHFTPTLNPRFNQLLMDDLEIIISDPNIYESFKYVFILLLNSEFSGYHQLHDYVESYFECSNIFDIAFKKCCYTDTFEKYTEEFKYPLSKERYIIMSNASYRWAEYDIQYIISDFNLFTQKNLSIQEAIEILSDISIKENLHYSNNDDENKRRQIILAIDEYYFNERKTYLAKAQELKLKYPNSCKFSPNVPFYLLLRFSGDIKKVVNYLSDEV